jgi:uncharacterized protein (DUF433 family)
MNELLSRVTIDPDICHGKPVVRGLRYPVDALLEYLAAECLKNKTQHFQVA